MKVKSFKKQIREASKPLLYEEENEWGKYQVKESTKKVIVKDGKIERIPGIITKILIKPSSKYKKKVQERKKRLLKVREEKKKVQDREDLINNRIREIAIRELKKEGKLD